MLHFHLQVYELLFLEGILEYFTSKNVWRPQIKEDSSISFSFFFSCCITNAAPSESGATCLQYAALRVIALWIVHVCACMCVCVFLQSWGRSAVQWGAPSCWCPRSSSSSGSCVRRIWYVSPHPLHAPPPSPSNSRPPPPLNTDIILHKSCWQASRAVIYYASGTNVASLPPFSWKIL